ncbi:hypothetical protein J7382_15230 [Shimia sp. R11_0]|nr:hypothetical protein [Shimia sp. R11_0]MBO9478899.1 hypothetical protein [Shimia sp. R11_0]
MTLAPTISTPRLTLRHHEFDDFEPMAAPVATMWAQLAAVANAGARL